jgi:hypothetical protein
MTAKSRTQEGAHGRSDPDFSADGVFPPDDLKATAPAFRMACIQVGAIANRADVRQAVACLIAQHNELGLCQIEVMAKTAAKLGRSPADDHQPLTFFR